MSDYTQFTQEEHYQIGMRIHLLSATGELNQHQITEHPLPDYAHSANRFLWNTHCSEPSLPIMLVHPLPDLWQGIHPIVTLLKTVEAHKQGFGYPIQHS